MSLKPDCRTDPSHPSCRNDDGTGSPSATVDIDGSDGVITTGIGVIATNQPAEITRDSESRLEIDQSAFHDELRLATLAGSPTVADIGACVTNRALTSDELQRLIERLNDMPQDRGRLVARIDKNNLGAESRHHNLFHNWVDDGDGRQYRTWIFRSNLAPERTVTATEVAPDVFVYSGGSIASWETGADALLLCPNGGTITMTLTR